jgi:hypothetical protein
MTELELTRTAGDRRLYALGDLGKLRLEGVFSRKATAEAGADRWRFTSQGFWQRSVQATDSMGAVVGKFEPRSFRRGGTLGWAGRELALRPASSWRERYALADGDRELAILDGKSWGRQPVKFTSLSQKHWSRACSSSLPSWSAGSRRMRTARREPLR